MLTEIHCKEKAVIEAVTRAEEAGQLQVLYEELTENCLWFYDPVKKRLVINKYRIKGELP